MWCRWKYLELCMLFPLEYIADILNLVRIECTGKISPGGNFLPVFYQTLEAWPVSLNGCAGGREYSSTSWAGASCHRTLLVKLGSQKWKGKRESTNHRRGTIKPRSVMLPLPPPRRCLSLKKVVLELRGTNSLLITTVRTYFLDIWAEPWKIYGISTNRECRIDSRCREQWEKRVQSGQ